MKTFIINSSVILFNHDEYGSRVLFKKGLTNPRDQLGKNGVTVHGWLASFFYNVVPIVANVLDKNGTEKQQILYANRNSLNKYLGYEESKSLSNSALIDKLNQTPSPGDNESSQDGLRHAGRHNHRSFATWYTRFIDYTRGSFLGWLYQTTIRGFNRMAFRLLFVRKESELFETGEILAENRFYDAMGTVPAYKAFVGEKEVSKLMDIPITSKDNYIKPQSHDSDTHRHGKYPPVYKKDTSTGTSGKPTEWIRGVPELETVKNSLKLAAKLQFGDRRVNYINAFAFGPWATGLTTYELMRDTGSVFATGPDKEKIVDHLVSTYKYEQHQIELAVESFKKRKPSLTGQQTTLIVDLLKEALVIMIRNKEASLTNVLLKCIESISNVADQTFLKYYSYDLLTMATELNKDRQLYIISGYPPFLKDLTDYAKQKGYDFKSFSTIGVVGGQGISEAMRDQLVQHGFNQVFSSYGASDLDINLGVETEYEISVRKIVEKNPEIAKELYGKSKGLPMIFHYDPMNYHIECDNEDELIFTCVRNDRSSPRLRYNLGDKGRVYASSDIQAVLAKHGFFPQPKSNLPLMFLWGRDSTVVFGGANLAFTELERVITDNEALEKIVLKKAFYAYQDKEGVDKLEIWLELVEGTELPTEQEIRTHASNLMSDLVRSNQDFKFQVNALGNDADLPMVRFFTHGTSPISDAGGHRKQVLIFQPKINLPDDYIFPGADFCAGVNVKKSEIISAARMEP